MRTGAEATLWVIDPSVSTAEEQGVGAVLESWPGRSRVFRPALRPGDGPGPGTGYRTDGIVLMGSAASVHDDPAWLGPLAAWLAPLLCGSPRVPVLGICFGHQLVGHLAGATVGFLSDDRSKRVGVEWSELGEGRLLGAPAAYKVVVSHREAVHEAPAGYRVTARRPGVPVDGLEHGDLPIFSYQFHPEAREEFVLRAGLEAAAVDARVLEDSQRLLGSFRSLVLAP